MPTEKDKMLRGALYQAADPELAAARRHTRMLLQQFNRSDEEQTVRHELLKKLIPTQGSELWIEPPFYCDYGFNIKAGDKVYFNFNCVVLDVMEVTIGSHVLIGPSVQIYTAMHPMNWKERASGLEFAKPVIIGDHVWIGGGAVICPGVTIGHRSVIGAGSVVTKDIPDDVFAAGNPCRPIKPLL